MIEIKDTESLALSNKLAAWNERGIARDLYDIYFLVRSGVSPDLGSLAKRLDHISYPKGVKGPKRMTMDEFLAKLDKAVAVLTEEDLDGLRDILPSDELVGLDRRIRSIVRDLVEKIALTHERAGKA